MTAYSALAAWYDELTRDVPYAAFADYYERLFAERGGETKLLLDLCCGTGTLACLMAERGYEMIAADASADMLMSAREKASALSAGKMPLFINQSAQELDLYGTVDAAYSSLDSLSYVPFEDLPEVFRRLHLFVRPGGLLVFDLRTPEFLLSMDGSVSVDEREDLFCVWRGRFEDAALYYGMDIFYRSGRAWQRASEEHIEYAHEPEAVASLLRQAGFENIKTRTDGPMGGAERVFFTAVRGE